MSLRLTGRSFAFAAIVLICLASTGLGFVDPHGGTGGGPIAGSITVTVIRATDFQPIAGAFVMIGDAPDHPVNANYGLTSALGQFELTDSELEGPVMVTAGASGYQYLSLIQVDASEIVLPLSLIENTPQTHQIGDFVSGIDLNNGTAHYGDGYVDLAFVIPAFSIQTISSLSLDQFVGPLETIEIMGTEVQMPSNMFIPQQWELFVEITKDHYYLYLPADDYTLTALSARLPRDEMIEIMQGGGDVMDLLPLITWKETDLLDVTVSGATNSADLNVDPDLTETVTMNLSNVPDGFDAIGISAGDLDGLNGSGRIVPFGFDALECPSGSGPCSGTIRLPSTAASGEYAGMGYLAAVALQTDASNDSLVILDRQDHSQTYTTNLNSFFDTYTLTYSIDGFAFNDVFNSTTGSPPVDLTMARLADPDTDAVYWMFFAPGDVLTFSPPILPSSAPPAPVSGQLLTWEHTGAGLDYELTSFDFNAFGLSDVTDHTSHIATDSIDISFIIPGIATPTPTVVPPTPTPSPPPTPTQPPCTTLGCEIQMPSHEFVPGDACWCQVVICNPNSETYSAVPVFAILDVYGSYFFAPSFSSFDHYVRDISPGTSTIDVLTEFAWPAGAGTADGIRWYSAMTNAEMTALFGELGTFDFGWHD